MAKVFCIDVSKCSGCYNCQFACKDEHCNNEWLPYTLSQPLTGQFWLKIIENIQGTKPKVRMHYYPVLCNHCNEPECIKAAKDNAVYKRADGLVIIDPVKSRGQKTIADACPYGAIYWNEELEIPQKCTGCAHLVDEGRVPRCVDVCHTGAIRFGEEEEFADFIKSADVFKAESGTGPNVYYRNIPGRFIGGTIYDPIEEAVIRNAGCHLISDSEEWEVYTDIFGDFWFNDLKQGVYDLSIEAPGYKKKEFKRINTTFDSINLGDIPLEPSRAEQ